MARRSRRLAGEGHDLRPFIINLNIKLETIKHDYLVSSLENTKLRQELKMQEDIFGRELAFLDAQIKTVEIERDFDAKWLGIEMKRLQKMIDDVKSWTSLMKEKVPEAVKKEQELGKSLQAEYKSLIKENVKEAVERNGEAFSWQTCSICVTKYSTEQEHTPRILDCGHTLCLGCCRNFVKGKKLTCPFDRQEIALEGNIKNITINRYVLNFC
uniref:RING-type domain-containing protein n=1 Tax=Caenorhabditis tropicalis TaxID=1561998 RepID=A0A1I7T9W9_9PELO